MLSVTGKGYSKIYRENPFYEEPPPKPHYYPTPQKQLSEVERQVGLSPKRAEGRKQQTEDQDVERKFLAGSHTIRSLAAVQNHHPKSPGSSNFDESWPDSERPSSPSVTAEDKSGQEFLPYASVRRHVQPAFTSSLVSGAGLSKHPLDDYLTSRSAVTPGRGDQHFSMSHSKAVKDGRVTLERERGQGAKSGADRGKDGGRRNGVPEEKGSVLQSYIDRFRHGKPMSRDERLTMEANQKREFWWLESSASPPTPNSTSTPKEEQGRSVPLTSHGRGTLTVENLRKRDNLDTDTADLQNKADRLLYSAKSIGSSEPVVSTDGLGSTGSDVTGSSFSEPAVRPDYFPREHAFYPRPTGGANLAGRPRDTTPHDGDILYKWRLHRKLEVARDAKYVPTESAECSAPKTAAEKEIHSRLSAFKEKLQQRGSVVSTQLQEARVEKAMKHVQSVMDAGSQTSPARTPPTSFKGTAAHPPSWSYPQNIHTFPETSSGGFLNDRSNATPANAQTSDGARNEQSQSRTDSGLKSESVVDGLTEGDAKILQEPSAQKGVKMETVSETVEVTSSPDSQRQAGVTDSAGSSKQTASTRASESEGQSENTTDAQECGAKTGDVKYRQFLEAEKPHDGGDTPVKHQVSRTHAASSADSERRDERRPASSHARQSVMGSDGDRVFDARVGSSGDARKKKRSDGAKRGDDDVDSDHSSASSQSKRGGRKSQKKNGGVNADVARDDRASPREHANRNNTRGKESEKCVDGRAEREKSNVNGRIVASDSRERAHAGQQRSGVERSQRSGVMPPPQCSSSPARTSLTSAIGQVVQDRVFDMSGSVMSSVESLSSLQHSADSPLPPRHQPSVTEADYESDGQFEDDPLLQVLRQQRHLHEAQLRVLDAVLAERNI
ncbi:microtubule-associated protein futsch-like [Littorina saxatilis]|uniref:Uncharacterized protein n=1 Tax=Littorina saxatilis TaxID=31220 RepID=A0AAN9BND4_9CAEN